MGKIRLKPLVLPWSDGDGSHTKVQWVKGNDPKNNGPGYLRLESDEGKFLGALSDRQLRKLKEWMRKFP